MDTSFGELLDPFSFLSGLSHSLNLLLHDLILLDDVISSVYILNLRSLMHIWREGALFHSFLVLDLFGGLVLLWSLLELLRQSVQVVEPVACLAHHLSLSRLAASA
jgi:hypothetical protein